MRVRRFGIKSGKLFTFQFILITEWIHKGNIIVMKETIKNISLNVNIIRSIVCWLQENLEHFDELVILSMIFD